MNLSRILSVLLFCPVFCGADNNQALEQGKSVYRSNCGFCHGGDARGGRGPNLVSSQLTQAESDEALRNVIRNGVPGSTMPAFDGFEKDDLDQLVLYLRTLARGNPSTQPVPGDPAKGRLVYQRSGCASCHRIGLEGSVYGPELSRIGGARSSEYIRQSILEPSADIPDEYQGVTVVTRQGKRITGVRINEDTFSVQLRDLSQAFRMYQKDGLREVIHERKSLMPPYQSLPNQDLQNLLAYLDRLRGEASSTGVIKKPEAVR